METLTSAKSWAWRETSSGEKSEDAPCTSSKDSLGSGFGSSSWTTTGGGSGTGGETGEGGVGVEGLQSYRPRRSSSVTEGEADQRELLSQSGTLFFTMARWKPDRFHQKCAQSLTLYTIFSSQPKTVRPANTKTEMSAEDVRVTCRSEMHCKGTIS